MTTILIVSAHPDDETLGAGGTILRHAAQGDAVHWLIVSAGWEPKYPAATLATKRREDFYRCLSEKLLTYAIGRGVEYYDATTIDQLVERLEKKDGKLRELIYAIAESAPFQKRRGDD